MLDHVTEARGPQHATEHDHERVDLEDGGNLMGRVQPGRAGSCSRSLRRGGRKGCAAAREWREWADLFTEDAEYLEHTYRTLQWPSPRSTSGSSRS